MKRFLATLLTVMTFASLAAIPAVAAEGAPVITGPTEGQRVSNGWSGPITVDFTGALTGTYDIGVYADGEGGSWNREYQFDGTNPMAVVSGSRINKEGRYYAYVAGPTPEYNEVEVAFIVRPPSATIQSPRDGEVLIQDSGVSARALWSSISPDADAVVEIFDRTRWRNVERCKWYSVKPGDVTTCRAATLRPGNYAVRAIALRNYNEDLLDAHRFTVQRRLFVDDVSTSEERFFPLVRDGYRDRTILRFRSSATSDNEISVRNASGSVVRREDLGNQRAGRHSWSWSGRRKDGSTLKPGTYQISLVARGTQKQVERASRSVRIDTDWRTARVTRVRDGYDTTSSDGSSNCYTTYDSYFGELNLDCWGGRRAEANYRFTVPANAVIQDWSVAGDIMCCRGGPDKSAARLSSEAFRVTVAVSGWRGYVIRRVRVEYTYRRRI